MRRLIFMQTVEELLKDLEVLHKLYLEWAGEEYHRMKENIKSGDYGSAGVHERQCMDWQARAHKVKIAIDVINGRIL
jgi:hypothetical protein